MQGIRQALGELLTAELFESAIVVCQYLVRLQISEFEFGWLCADTCIQLADPQTSPEDLPELRIRYADALFGDRQFRRALDQLSQVPEAAAAATSPHHPDLGLEGLQWRKARCLTETKRPDLALAELLRIPSDRRSLRSSLLLGRLLELDSQLARAAGFYREALQRNPLALEAATALLRLGQPPQTVGAGWNESLSAWADRRRPSAQIRAPQPRQPSTARPTVTTGGKAGVQTPISPRGSYSPTVTGLPGILRAGGQGLTGRHMRARSSTQQDLRTPQSQSVDIRGTPANAVVVSCASRATGFRSPASPRHLPSLALAASPRASPTGASRTTTGQQQPRGRSGRSLSLDIPVSEEHQATPRAKVKVWKSRSNSPRHRGLPQIFVWVPRLLAAQGSLDAGQTLIAVQQFTDLSMQFPGCSHALAGRAYAEAQAFELSRPLETFERLLQQDPGAIEHLDCYAFLLHLGNRKLELSHLAASLVGHTPERPESWVASAYYARLMGRPHKSLEYLSRAEGVLWETQRPGWAGVQAAYGWITLAAATQERDGTEALPQAQKLLDRSRLYFSLAHSKQPACILTLAGLVESAIRMKQWQLAVQTAKRALTRLPRNPKSLVLIGRVLSFSPSTREKSVHAFRKALALDPLCASALIHLTDLFAGYQNYGDAVQSLRRYAQPFRSPFMHTRLAEYLTKLDQHDEANEQLQQALLLRQSRAGDQPLADL